MQKQESGSTPRVATRRTTVFYLCIEKLAVSQKATLRWLRTSCRWRTPVRAAVFCRTPSEAGGRSKLRPSRHYGHADLSAVAFGEGGTRDPTDVATGPAAGCPPVCQRPSFPAIAGCNLAENVRNDNKIRLRKQVVEEDLA